MVISFSILWRKHGAIFAEATCYSRARNSHLGDAETEGASSLIDELLVTSSGVI
jgi:hypothetical protein